MAVYRKQHPDKILEAARRAWHKRRAVLRNADAESFSAREIFIRDRWKCGICGRKINPKLKHPHPRSSSLDHIVPISRGGGHVRTNVRASHLACNLLRGNRGGNEQLMLIG
ncbi:HNH endonuclease [Micromonospora sp. ATA32]|nr:HNH endonuclease [Micromonospora sp. ATA32]